MNNLLDRTIKVLLFGEKTAYLFEKRRKKAKTSENEEEFKEPEGRRKMKFFGFLRRIDLIFRNKESEKELKKEEEEEKPNLLPIYPHFLNQKSNNFSANFQI